MPSIDHVNAAELTFTAPAEWVWRPGEAAPERGWYRVRVAPVPGFATYPQQYALIVQKNPEREAFAEVD